jgi:hypothetical protein
MASNPSASDQTTAMAVTAFRRPVHPRSCEVLPAQGGYVIIPPEVYEAHAHTLIRAVIQPAMRVPKDEVVVPGDSESNVVVGGPSKHPRSCTTTLTENATRAGKKVSRVSDQEPKLSSELP